MIFGDCLKRKKKKKIKTKTNVKWKKVIRDKIIRYIKTLLEQEEDYYKPERVRNSWKNNYIEYESNGNKNRNLSLDKDLPKIKPHLRNIIINLQSSEAWKIQIWRRSDCNWTRTQNHLVLKRTLNHLTKLASSSTLPLPSISMVY